MGTSSTNDKISGAEIHFAPMQGFTDMAYYSAFSKHFAGVGYYYTPFFCVDDRLERTFFAGSDLVLEKLVWQILPKDIDEMKVLTHFVLRQGGSMLNINLGCPYPMVTRRGRGAALISNPEMVVSMIDYIRNYTPLTVSIKTRLGLSRDDEVFPLLEALARKSCTQVIVHARTATQLYKGNVNTERFLECRLRFPEIDFVYNGDIVDTESFLNFTNLFQGQYKWMIGRGLLCDPFLADRITDNSDCLSELKRKDILQNFVFDLIEGIVSTSNDTGHALNRLKNQFIYLANAFPEPKRITRLVRRSKSTDELKTELWKKF